MRQIWDRLWPKRAVLDIDEVVAYDSGYSLLKRLIGPLPIDGLNILEVGCGSGICTLALLRQSKGALGNSASLIDYSTAALVFARKNMERNGAQANLILADAFKLPFPDSVFDIVWNEGVNEHFRGEERQLIFNEMARVCKLEGQVIVIVPNSLNIFYRLWKEVLERQRKWEYGPEIPYSVFELRSKLRKAGLMPTKISGRGTLASFSFLVRLITREKGDKGADAPANTNKGLRILRKIVLLTDSLLGFVGAFTGAEIGIKGLKPA